MRRTALRSCSLLFIGLLSTTMLATEPTKSHKFPAKIQIVEAVPAASADFIVRLTAEQGVPIYANQPNNVLWNHVAARLTIRDANHNPVDAQVTYPKGTKIDTTGLGDLFVYRDAVDIHVVIADKTVIRPLTVTLEGAAFDLPRSFCLGEMKLQTVRE